MSGVLCGKQFGGVLAQLIQFSVNPERFLSPNICLMCWANVVSESHLLPRCPFAQGLWWKLLQAANIMWVFFLLWWASVAMECKMTWLSRWSCWRVSRARLMIKDVKVVDEIKDYYQVDFKNQIQGHAWIEYISCHWICPKLWLMMNRQLVTLLFDAFTYLNISLLAFCFFIIWYF